MSIPCLLEAIRQAIARLSGGIEGGELMRNLPIAFSDLSLIEIIEIDGLFQAEQMLGTKVPVPGTRDGRLVVPAARVPQASQYQRIALARQDGPNELAGPDGELSCTDIVLSRHWTKVQ